MNAAAPEPVAIPAAPRPDSGSAAAFEAFFREVEPRLRRALVAAYGGRTVLTAAMVQHVEAASRAAIAPAGHMLVSVSTDLKNHYSQDDSSVSIDYTYSGHDFNAIERLRTSAGETALTIIRQVDGQLYNFGPARQWYRLHGEAATSRNVPDPRELLTALRPDAGFENIGSQVIDGATTTILRATRLGRLPASILSALGFVFSVGDSLTQFDVWVDHHGIVRQMKIIRQGHNADPPGIIIGTQTIRFLDIGKPEPITTPPSYSDKTP